MIEHKKRYVIGLPAPRYFFEMTHRSDIQSFTADVRVEPKTCGVRCPTNSAMVASRLCNKQTKRMSCFEIFYYFVSAKIPLPSLGSLEAVLFVLFIGSFLFWIWKLTIKEGLIHPRHDFFISKMRCVCSCESGGIRVYRQNALKMVYRAINRHTLDPKSLVLMQ